MSGREGGGSRVIQSSSQEQWGCVKWKHKQNEPRQDGGQPHQQRDQSLVGPRRSYTNGNHCGRLKEAGGFLSKLAGK